MDPRLLSVTKSGNVDALYSLIQADPYILQNIDVLPFIHTPLHEASFTGKIDLAMELMILKPSFAKKLNANGYSPLHLAVENHQVELALELVKFDPSLVRIRGKGGMTPLHLVAEKGDADLLTEFLIACPESIRDANVNGETALHITVRYNRYEELKVLTGWMQRMRKSDAKSTENHVLNRCDREGNTALHIAAYENNPESMCNGVGRKTHDFLWPTNGMMPRDEGRFKDVPFKPRHSASMNSRMLLVTQSGSVDDLYSLIKAAPDILQNADVLPFVHTPLHEASSTGKIDLAMELMLLKPSFAKKLNEDGFSPLHLAVENKQDTLAIELVKFDPSLVHIRGRGGMTPLHLVAKKGGVDLLIKFLQACPGSINDANLNGETAVHITVMNNKYEKLKILIGWMQKMRSSDGAFCEIHVMNQCDREGNTALHLAAYENNHKAVKQLIKCMSLNRNIQNKSKLTALDVLQTNGAHMNMDTVKILQKSGGKTGGSIRVQTMHEFLRKPVTFPEYCSTGIARYRRRMSDGARNSLLVITGLIIAATYQSAAQPKDKDDNKDWEKLVIQFVLQWGFNTIAFGAAMVLTFILLPFGGAYTWWYIVITVPLVCSYGLCLYIKFRSYQQWLVILTYVMILFGSLVYLLIFYVRWKRNMHKKVPKPKRELTSQKTTV